METLTKHGFYIVGEGNDGTGKSTQINLLAKYFEKEYGLETYTMHEPDGCLISSEIRTILKNGSLERDAVTNLLLFTASRHETWFREAMPVLENGGVVLSARSYLSSLMYQGLAEGLGMQYVQEVTAAFMNERYMTPDLTVIFELEDKLRNERIGARGQLANPDTFESQGDSYQAAVNGGYKQIAADQDFAVINAGKSIEVVQRNFRRLAIRAMVGRALQ
ncbi:dTMP kinase [Candidatus Saccharibacteria bacterium]|nr:dTMP kinase [Candidatus Saccharibacteria bacterium]